MDVIATIAETGDSAVMEIDRMDTVLCVKKKIARALVGSSRFHLYSVQDEEEELLADDSVHMQHLAVAQYQHLSVRMTHYVSTPATYQQEHITAASVAHTTGLLATMGSAGKVTVFCVRTERTVASLRVNGTHKRSQFSLVFADCETSLFVSTEKKILRVDLRLLETNDHNTTELHLVDSIAFTRYNSCIRQLCSQSSLLCGAGSRGISIWDSQDLRHRTTLSGENTQFVFVACSEGKVFGSGQGRIFVWDVASYVLLHSVSQRLPQEQLCATRHLSVQGGLLFCVANDRAVMYYVDTMHVAAKGVIPESFEHICPTPCGSAVFCSYNKGELAIWNGHTLQREPHSLQIEARRSYVKDGGGGGAGAGVMGKVEKMLFSYTGAELFVAESGTIRVEKICGCKRKRQGGGL